MRTSAVALVRLILRAGSVFCLVLFTVGLIVRLTVRDRFDGLSVIFYATPWPVLAVLLIFPMILWAGFRRLKLTAIFVILFVGCLVCWISRSWFRNAVVGTPASFRALYWNTAHPARILPNVIEKVRASGADIIGLAEVECRRLEDTAAWQSAFPGYTVRTLRGELLLITRAEILSAEDESLAQRGHCQILKLNLRGRRITLMFVDFSAHVLRSRRPPFERLYQILNARADEEIILMGDFNTPRDSVYFDPLRKSMSQAFESAGNGLVETWPVPLPVLTLDHIWTTRSHVTRCVPGFSWMSDHRPLAVDISE